MAGCAHNCAPRVVAPLTTIFTPPFDCLGPTYSLGDGNNDTFVSETSVNSGTTSTSYTLIHGFTSSCLPSSAWDVLYVPHDNGASFSPAKCPSGYTTATGNFVPDATSEGTTIYGQTTALCCPSAWSLSYDSTIGASNFSCQSYGTPTIISGGDTSVLTTEIPQYVKGIAVYYANSDQFDVATTTSSDSGRLSTLTGSFTVTTANPGGIAASVAYTTATGTFAATPPPSSLPPSSSGLSTGAQAAIGIGVAVVAILLASVLAFFLLRRRRRRKSPSDQVSDAGTFEKSELPGKGLERAELNDTSVNEVDGTGRPWEMDPGNVRAELEGDWRGWEAPGHSPDKKF